jgi:hypothetical protein
MKPDEVCIELNITDEEWIAAGQACCGIDWDEPTKPSETPITVDISAESAYSVRS